MNIFSLEKDKTKNQFISIDIKGILLLVCFFPTYDLPAHEVEMVRSFLIHSCPIEPESGDIGGSVPEINHNLPAIIEIKEKKEDIPFNCSADFYFNYGEGNEQKLEVDAPPVLNVGPVYGRQVTIDVNPDVQETLSTIETATLTVNWRGAKEQCHKLGEEEFDITLIKCPKVDYSKDDPYKPIKDLVLLWEQNRNLFVIKVSNMDTRTGSTRETNTPSITGTISSNVLPQCFYNLTGKIENDRVELTANYTGNTESLSSYFCCFNDGSPVNISGKLGDGIFGPKLGFSDGQCEDIIEYNFSEYQSYLNLLDNYDNLLKVKIDETGNISGTAHSLAYDNCAYDITGKINGKDFLLEAHFIGDSSLGGCCSIQEPLSIQGSLETGIGVGPQMGYNSFDDNNCSITGEYNWSPL